MHGTESRASMITLLLVDGVGVKKWANRREQLCTEQ